MTTSWTAAAPRLLPAHPRTRHELLARFPPRARHQPGGPRASGRDGLADEGTLSTTLRSPRTAGPDDHCGLADGPDPHGAGHRRAPRRRPEQAPQLAAAPTDHRARLDDDRSGIRPPWANRLRVAEGRSVQSCTSCCRIVGRGPELPHRALRTDGPKRSGQKQAFVPSVNAAVDAFYEQVVSALRAPSGRSLARCPTRARDDHDRAARREADQANGQHGIRPNGEHDRNSLSVRGWTRAGALVGLFVPAARRAQGRSAAAGRDLRLRPRRRREPPPGPDRHAAGRTPGAAHPPSPRVGRRGGAGGEARGP